MIFLPPRALQELPTHYEVCISGLHFCPEQFNTRAGFSAFQSGVSLSVHWPPPAVKLAAVLPQVTPLKSH